MDTNDKNKVNEPAVAYNRKITFFNSFQEAEEHGLKEMANHSFVQRMQNLEILRKRMFADRLDANGNWPCIERVITIVKGGDA